MLIIGSHVLNVLFIFGIIGMLVAGWATDKLFAGKAHRTCVFCMVGTALFMTIFWLLPPTAPFIVIICTLAMAGFFIYGPQALIGIAAANQATKKAAATANGLTGIFGYLSVAVSGLGVGKGYINREELTKEKFIQNKYYEYLNNNEVTFFDFETESFGDNVHLDIEVVDTTNNNFVVDKVKENDKSIRIDFDGIIERVIPLPGLRSGEYFSLNAADYALYYISYSDDNRGLYYYDIKEKKSENFRFLFYRLLLILHYSQLL